MLWWSLPQLPSSQEDRSCYMRFGCANDVRYRRGMYVPFKDDNFLMYCTKKCDCQQFCCVRTEVILEVRSKVECCLSGSIIRLMLQKYNPATIELPNGTRPHVRVEIGWTGTLELLGNSIFSWSLTSSTLLHIEGDAEGSLAVNSVVSSTSTMTSAIHILAPKSLYNSCGYLIGEYQHSTTNVNRVTTLTLLGIHKNVDSIQASCEGVQIVGYIAEDKEATLPPVIKELKKKSDVWIEFLGGLSLHQVYLHNKRYHFKGVLIIEYDMRDVLRAEILRHKYGTLRQCDLLSPLNSVIWRMQNCKEPTCNFYNLVFDKESQRRPYPWIWTIVMWILVAIDNVMSVGCKIPNSFLKVVMCSAVGEQVVCRLRQIYWCTSELKSKSVSWRVKNCITSILLDFMAGIMLFYCLNQVVSIQGLLNRSIGATEVVVDRLQTLIRWLMGYPAGLKLNAPLSETLGRFFLYHIYLWKTYIDTVHPWVWAMLELVLALGWGGFTFQLAALQDLLFLATFHVYCFYVYAARIYNLQVRALSSLWRLFLGQKWNPLRNRVDSCRYTVDELFIGALLFTVLLFLLPTTLVYYIVFVSLRLAVMTVAGVISWFRILTSSFPWWSILLWVLRSPTVGTDVCVAVSEQDQDGQALRIRAHVTTTSLQETVAESLPTERPTWSHVDWSMLLANLVTGALIYPM